LRPSLQDGSYVESTGRDANVGRKAVRTPQLTTLITPERQITLVGTLEGVSGLPPPVVRDQVLHGETSRSWHPASPPN